MIYFEMGKSVLLVDVKVVIVVVVDYVKVYLDVKFVLLGFIDKMGLVDVNVELVKYWVQVVCDVLKVVGVVEDYIIFKKLEMIMGGVDVKEVWCVEIGLVV